MPSNLRERLLIFTRYPEPGVTKTRLIPILGAFFRSTRDELAKKELAFFITPKLVKPLAPGVRPELPGDKPLTPNEERSFDWIPVPHKSEGK